MNTQIPSAIERAASLAGGVSNLATACQVSAQAVYKWISKGYPPTDRCAAIEMACDGRVSRLDLLPPSFSDAPVRRRRKQTVPP